ncbi:TonB-dependent receptor [Flavobacterium branchiophilum]|uniref:Ferric enterobactin receptor n=1 Tax=Flavobacterium branchiophilum TaxID=55197 RepID=A0A2H3KFP3_9FLAO|nr:TonB-dependent receptor [Flavobacterium branchiophilum]PDS26298.1 ferric enterobactin receptor [Flavobacterium branchiophilum]
MKKIILFLLLLNFSFAMAQKEVSGKVTDKSGAALPGVNVTEKGATNGVSTDLDGNYKIKVKDGATLVFSYVGYAKVERKSTNGVINVTLSEEGGQSLDEIVVVGTRTAPRSNTTSALPVDVLSAKDLNSTGQATFDKALQYKIPSFNTVQTPVNDATSLLDPYEIRNMGPSRTLVLINGKRKNMSSLVYVQTSPGRGETGADISAIPTDAIERVEILRDGASAQYGSDAIAGVMNIILKKSTTGGSTTFRSGITGEGDGKMLGFSINNGTTVGEKGFINYTVDFSKVTLANRPGTVNADGEIADFGASPSEVNAFLAKYPDAGNINGSPETAAAKFEMNGGSDLTDHSKIYYNAAYVYKKVNSFANYRTPYWRDLASMPYLADLFAGGSAASYKGYVPTFEGDLNDYNATLGYKSTINGWNTDASVTIGGNQQMYTVSNSQNRSSILLNGQNVYRENSPITFKPGGTNFNHIVGNIDVNRALSDKVSFAFGSEFRSENFEIFAGDKASYEGSGADSFQGNTPENSGKFNRYNLGVYGDISADINKDFLINGTVRFENYSDFGTAAVWKLSSRYKLMDDKLTFRGSVSTGFRAPSLHQIYTEKSQSSFQAGGAIVISGIINNVSASARKNGIAKLDSEKSTNVTFGLGFKPTKQFSLTLDYYNILVKDRILLSEKINFGNGADQAFFVNGMDTRTSGLDFVASYRNIMLGTGKLNLNLSGNNTFQNERVGEVKNPQSVKNVNQTVINDTQEALLFSSRPKYKYILGGDYEIGKFVFSLNNTVFGPTKFLNAGLQNLENLLNETDPLNTSLNKDGKSDLGIRFVPKVVTDLAINYNASKKITISLNVNNLFNVLPKWEFQSKSDTGSKILSDAGLTRKASNLITFNGRYSQMTYDGYHFSQLGTMFNLSLNYKF